MTSELGGRRIVVTRAVEQATPLIAAIEARNGRGIALPLLEIVEPVDGGAALVDSLAKLSHRDWLVVLSPNGARQVVRNAHTAHLVPGCCSLAVIAHGTASVLEAAGWSVDLCPETASSEGLLEAFDTIPIEGRVLIAQAEAGRTILADGLAARGVDVSTVVAYRNVMPTLDSVAIDRARGADTVVFASPSAVDRYTDNVGVLPRAAVCIGAVTAAAATKAGFEVTIAPEPSVEAIVGSL